jgi:hypothetical protein
MRYRAKLTVHFDYDLDADTDNQAVNRIEELLRSAYAWPFAASNSASRVALWNTIERLGDDD